MLATWGGLNINQHRRRGGLIVLGITVASAIGTNLSLAQGKVEMYGNAILRILAVACYLKVDARASYERL